MLRRRSRPASPVEPPRPGGPPASAEAVEVAAPQADAPAADGPATGADAPGATAVRWTAHGPEVAAEEPPVDEPADEPTEEPVEEPTEAEAGSASAAPVVAAAPGAEEDLQAIRARLAARGLVRTEPSVRIRDIAGGRRPESAPAAIAPTKGDLFDVPADEAEAVGDDADAIEAEPFGPTQTTRCPSCRTTQQVAVDATGYRCGNCDKVWRWGICSSCSHLALTIARQESWRCTDCGGYSRSWWRTATASREAKEVVGRKRADAADRERQRILGIARRRRWKLILAGVVVVLVAGVSALFYSSTDAGSPADQARATCTTWTALKSDIANGALTPQELTAALDSLAAAAEGATAEVQLAAERLRTAGRPGDATFLVASTALSDACAGPSR